MKKAIEIRLFTIEGAECHRDAKMTIDGGELKFAEPKMNKKYCFALEFDGDCMVSKDGKDFYLAEAIQLGGRRISVNDQMRAKVVELMKNAERNNGI